MGSFQLHVRRRVDAAAAPSSQPAMGSALGGDGTLFLGHVLGLSLLSFCLINLCLSPLHHILYEVTTCLAALGSTSNFELAPEELEKFAKDHSLNGGAAASSSTEDEEDDYTESLVYVSSPKVGCMQPEA